MRRTVTAAHGGSRFLAAVVCHVLMIALLAAIVA
ncbi:hypothetical protein FHU36_004720 [Nonomuraea muscovyensis]|uniref:Uncharacterized protein n=1 Tax=Nonomuraea muscovyensis TaxID=1124761 RepID=A0A7X0C452_9ACTN|nr:hypothetical protein [Nonomuraea muscovyensis]